MPLALISVEDARRQRLLDLVLDLGQVDLRAFQRVVAAGQGQRHQGNIGKMTNAHSN
jgi:hypothetical protein